MKFGDLVILAIMSPLGVLIVLGLFRIIMNIVEERRMERYRRRLK
jgi:hypothetical protein